jgi:hypothetical protein
MPVEKIKKMLSEKTSLGKNPDIHSDKSHPSLSSQQSESPAKKLPSKEYISMFRHTTSFSVVRTRITCRKTFFSKTTDTHQAIPLKKLSSAKIQKNLILSGILFPIVPMIVQNENPLPVLYVSKKTCGCY